MEINPYGARGNDFMSVESRYNTEHNYRSEKHIPNSRRGTYVDGNTVRKIQAEPKRREENLPERKIRRSHQRRPVRMAGIDGVSFMFLTAALVVVLAVAFSYISAQNDVHVMKNNVVELQTQISETKEANDEKYEEIIGKVDLSEVYKKATKKLNMVRAKKNQIYTYDNKKSGMVKQYADIPGVDE